MGDEYIYERMNLRNKLILRRRKDQVRLIPQIQNNNQDDYLAILSNIGVISHHNTPPHAGNRRVFRAYRYFHDRFKKLVEQNDNEIKTVVNFLDKVNQACLVKIEVASHAEAYTLFESLNNRGIPLTAIDLIKNKLLAQVESQEPSEVEFYFNEWNRILGYLGDKYTAQERFFRQYYNSFKDDLKVICKVPIATRSNLIHIYEELINHDVKIFLEKIIEAASLYSLLLLRNQDDTLKELEKDLDEPLRNLMRIQGATSYLLMLYLLVQKKELGLSNAHLALIVSLLVRFFVRRNLTDIPPTRDLPRLFIAIIDKRTNNSGHSLVEAIRGHLVKASASDDDFRRKLEGPIYEENYGVTRFILTTLAEQGMTKETKVDLWSLDEKHRKRFFWTIEHIFPQGENIPTEWVQMMAEGDDEKAQEIQLSHVHKLGNLTISGFNSSLSNKSFQEKRDRTDNKGRKVGYKNNLSLNEDLAIAESWSKQQIDIRTKKLADQTIELFRLDRDNV